MGERGVTYGLKYQARCLAAVESDNKKSRWLVGTSCLREYNEVSSVFRPGNSCILSTASNSAISRSNISVPLSRFSCWSSTQSVTRSGW